MLNHLERCSVKMEWVGPIPSSKKNFALLIPQFNEATNCDMVNRLKYFKELARLNKILI